MTYRERPPPPALRPFVDRFWWGVPSISAGLDPGVVLPDGCIDVLIDTAAGSVSVVGTMTRALVISESTPTCRAAVRFRPGAAGFFLGVPAHELTDKVIPSAEVGLRWLEPCQREFADPEAALATLEAVLLRQLGSLSADPSRDRVNRATRLLLRAPSTSISELASHVGWTRQHLGRVFRHHVGVGPKELGRISRLQHAVHRLQSAPSAELARTALELGYFDQAHMARDFRELAGITAASARAHAGSIFPIASLWLEA